MSLSSHKDSKFQGPASKEERIKRSARSRGHGRSSKTGNFFAESPLISLLLVLLFGLALISLCFLGAPLLGPHSYAHQKSPQRILSSLSFSFESEIRTRNLREERANRVPPVYTIRMGPYERFEQAWLTLGERLNEWAEQRVEETDPAIPPNQATTLSDDLRQRFPFRFSPSDMEKFAELTTPQTRAQISAEILPFLRNLFRAGIYSTESDFPASGSGLAGINLVRPESEPTSRPMESLPRAESTLYIEITGRYPGELGETLALLFREALVPNLEYDEARTAERKREAMNRVRPVFEEVFPGDIIVDTTEALSSSDLERLRAYRETLRAQHADEGWFNRRFREQAAFTILLLGLIYLFLRVTDNPILRNNRKVASTALLVLLQLGAVRAIIELADTGVFSNHPLTSQLIPYVVPYALAPILIGVLLGMGPGLFVAVFLALLVALMFNGSLLLFMIALTSSIVGLYFSRSIRKRSKLVKAGFMSGAAAALFPLLLTLSGDFDPVTIGYQIGLALTIGFLGGTLLVGILPLVESSFRFTTDITLLELTDYNHPLLRDLQLRAPGSYHHSLMLANLTENAAAAVGANPLLARVCSYFHDIGKMVKPEYFVENQVDGINPHLERNPSMSALVIKAHVKEGVALARQHHLPQVIIDVIQQHHGTTLIQYFFSMAKNREREKTRDPFGINRPVSSEISESTYRYDGPKPRFKESAIISLGDAIEAASRTLRKVSVQNIEELIEKLIDDRIQDGQLDESPLTFGDIRKIKKSFAFTLINSLHARIKYPEEPQPKKISPQPSETDPKASPQPSEPNP